MIKHMDSEKRWIGAILQPVYHSPWAKVSFSVLLTSLGLPSLKFWLEWFLFLCQLIDALRRFKNILYLSFCFYHVSHFQ